MMSLGALLVVACLQPTPEELVTQNLEQAGVDVTDPDGVAGGEAPILSGGTITATVDKLITFADLMGAAPAAVNKASPTFAANSITLRWGRGKSHTHGKDEVALATQSNAGKARAWSNHDSTSAWAIGGKDNGADAAAYATPGNPNPIGLTWAVAVGGGNATTAFVGGSAYAEASGNAFAFGGGGGNGQVGGAATAVGAGNGIAQAVAGAGGNNPAGAGGRGGDAIAVAYFNSGAIAVGGKAGNSVGANGPRGGDATSNALFKSAHADGGAGGQTAGGRSGDGGRAQSSGLAACFATGGNAGTTQNGPGGTGGEAIALSSNLILPPPPVPTTTYGDCDRWHRR